MSWSTSPFIYRIMGLLDDEAIVAMFIGDVGDMKG